MTARVKGCGPEIEALISSKSNGLGRVIIKGRQIQRYRYKDSSLGSAFMKIYD
jgi:hypothetical protein